MTIVSAILGSLCVALGFLLVGYVLGRVAAKPVIVGQAKGHDTGDSANLYDDDPYQEALEGPVDKNERTETT